MKIILLILPIIFSGCKVDVGSNESEKYKVIPMTENVSFNFLKANVLDSSCVKCHSWASDEAKVQQRINYQAFDDSQLLTRVKNGSMPPNGSLSAKQIKIIERYIKGSTPVETIPLNSTYQSVRFHLIEKSCLSCHNNVDMKKLSFESYEQVKKRSEEIIDILDYGETQGDPMPPIDENGNPKAPVPTKETVEAFRKWIEEGMQNN